MKAIKKLYWEDVKVGEEIPALSKVATTQMLVKWAGAVGDYNPHHFDDKFAEKVMKTNGIILHGSLKRAWLAQMLTDWIGPEGWLKQLTTQFRGMDYPRHMVDFTNPEEGETWLCKGKVTEKAEEKGEAVVKCEIWLENGSGERTTPGSAVVRLPKKG